MLAAKLLAGFTKALMLDSGVRDSGDACGDTPRQKVTKATIVA